MKPPLKVKATAKLRASEGFQLIFIPLSNKNPYSNLVGIFFTYLVFDN